MPFGIGSKTIMTGLVMTAISLIIFALIARFTGFDIRSL